MAAILIAGAVALSLQLRAQQGSGPGGRMNPQRASDAIKTVLDLTDRQYNELSDLRDAHNQKLQDLGAQIRDLDKQRRDAMAAGSNAAAIGALALQIQSLQQQMQDENKAYHDNALKVLDSAQKEKVKAIEDALKLAPSAGPLMQFGLLDTSQAGIGRGGFMGNAPGVMMRGGGGSSPAAVPADR